MVVIDRFVLNTTVQNVLNNQAKSLKFKKRFSFFKL